MNLARLLLLMETPIASFEKLGNWEQDAKPMGYDKASIGILNSEKGVEKIKDGWNKTDIDFDVYLLRSKEGNKYTELGRVSPEFVRDNLKLDIPFNDENITIIYTNNKGAERIPFTKWTAAHRLGHALRRDDTRRELNYHYEQLDKVINSLLDSVTKTIYRSTVTPSYWGNTDYDAIKRQRSIRLAVAHALGTMKSARDKNLRNPAELTNELIAQYIITGEVKLNDKLPQQLAIRYNWGHPDGPWKTGDKDVEEDMVDFIQNTESSLNQYISDLLYSSIGNIYVM